MLALVLVWLVRFAYSSLFQKQKTRVLPQTDFGKIVKTTQRKMTVDDFIVITSAISGIRQKYNTPFFVSTQISVVLNYSLSRVVFVQ